MVGNNNYHAQYIVFDIKKNAYSQENIENFGRAAKVEDLIVLDPSVTNNDRYRCYSTRNNKFRFRVGNTSLAKKLKVSPDAISIQPCIRRHIMPDHFFKLLNPALPINDQVAFSMGKYAETKLIKNYLETALKQNNNRQIVNSIEQEGSLATVKKGYMSVGQLKGATYYETKLSEIKDKESRLELDLPNGYYFPFECFKTNKIYEIYSEKEENVKDVIEVKKQRELIKDDHGKTFLKLKNKQKHCFVKRKHYYFYSKKPGYGKTTFINQIIADLNASQVTDTRNWMDISKHAQFLLIDEFSPDNKITMGKLKTLTSGNASAFGGNRKSYGSTFNPRKDAQLIIFSNYHLFDVMGRKNLNQESPCDIRKLTKQEAQILSDRFYIHRLDEDESDRTQNEKFDRYLHTLGYECDVHGIENGWC